MTDTNTTAEPVAVTAPVFDAFASLRKGSPGLWSGNRRVIFSDTGAAIAFISALTDKLTPVGEDGSRADFPVPTVTAGMTDEGDFGPAYQGAHVAITLLSTSPEYSGKGDARKLVKASEVLALVMYPQPTLEQFLAAPEGVAFVNRLIHKDCQLAALRAPRKADVDFATVARQMPLTAADFWTASERESSALSAEVTKRIDEVLRELRDKVKTAKSLWDRRLLKRETFINAIKSADFANNAGPDFAALENAETPNGVVSVWRLVVENSLPPAREAGFSEYVETIEAWLADRDTFKIGGEATEEEAPASLADELAAFL